LLHFIIVIIYSKRKREKRKDKLKIHTNIYKKKIAFLVRPGLDSFLNDIINGLSEEYETNKIIVNDYNQIEEGMRKNAINMIAVCSNK